MSSQGHAHTQVHGECTSRRESLAHTHELHTPPPLGASIATYGKEKNAGAGVYRGCRCTGACTCEVHCGGKKSCTCVHVHTDLGSHIPAVCLAPCTPGTQGSFAHTTSSFIIVSHSSLLSAILLSPLCSSPCALILSSSPHPNLQPSGTPCDPLVTLFSCHHCPRKVRFSFRLPPFLIPSPLPSQSPGAYCLVLRSLSLPQS